MAWLNLLLKGKKVAGAIKSVKPQVKPSGTKSLIDKYKKTVENVKSTPDVISRKKKAVKEIHGFVKKQGYKAREDESLGMRTGKESTKKQSMKDRRDESYGKWGKRKAKFGRKNKVDKG